MKKFMTVLMIMLIAMASLNGCYTCPSCPQVPPVQEQIEVPVFTPYMYENARYYYDYNEQVYRIRPAWRVPAYRGAPNIRIFNIEKMRENRKEMIEKIKLLTPEKRREIFKKRMQLRKQKPEGTRKDGTLSAPERALKRRFMLKATPDPEEKSSDFEQKKKEQTK